MEDRRAGDDAAGFAEGKFSVHADSQKKAGSIRSTRTYRGNYITAIGVNKAGGVNQPFSSDVAGVSRCAASRAWWLFGGGR